MEDVLERLTHQVRATTHFPGCEEKHLFCACYLEIEDLRAQNDAQAEEIAGLRSELDAHQENRTAQSQYLTGACDDVEKLRVQVVALRNEIKVDDQLLGDRSQFIKDLENIFGECEQHGSQCMPSLLEKIKTALKSKPDASGD